MTKKTRIIILAVCIFCFVVISPMLVFYSMGYRYDFKKNKITEIGGIYVRSFPAADEITVDSKINEKPGLLANDVYIQNLIPDPHYVLVKKKGYYDYHKTIPVEKREVTKLENILLIKKDIQFSLSEGIATSNGKLQSPFVSRDKYIIKNNNLYYSDITENSNLTSAQKTTPLLKKILAFTQQGNSIIWLSQDGFIYKSDLSGLNQQEKINNSAIKIVKGETYRIIAYDKKILINNNGDLMIFNNEIKDLEVFHKNIKNVDFSPDGKSIIYYDNNSIYVSTFIENKPLAKNLIYKTSEKINDCIWLNSSYVIISVNNKIIISEIDYRDNINSVTLSQTIEIGDKKINLEKPQIFFNQQEGKLYILTNKILIVSEKISS